MTLPWPLAVVGQFLLLLALVGSAAVPTQDTIVVSKFDVTTDTLSSVPTPSSVSSTDTTSEEPSPPVKITEMEVKTLISMRYANTAVVAHVRNPAKRAQEASFRVLLPETAFISGFVMTIDGKAYKAYVKEKEEAKNIYQQAVSSGIGAAHIAATARDSNHFTVTVNVEAAASVIFNLTYQEMLARRIDVYNYVVNLLPGDLVPKYTVTVQIKESTNITELRVPEIRTGNEIDAGKNDAQMSNVIIRREGSSAVITFSPDLEEQERLMHVYAEKSKESASGEYKGKGALGQFVVQYDVDRSNNGQILVNDGYFVHFFAPQLPPLNKYVVFVLDTSGSMMGRKIDQLHQAMHTILNELNLEDYFSIVDFDSTVTVHDLSEVDKEPIKRHYYFNEVQQELKLVEPYQATPENIEKARVIISRLEAFGGTNIASALNVAVDLVNNRGKNAKKNTSSNSTTTIPTTPTSADSTAAVAAMSTTDRNDGIKNLEPIIIFLTDGDPTVGETNTKTIINHLVEKNYGKNKATMFCLGFGDDAAHQFLRQLSLRNDGFSRHIYEASDAALQLRDFYRQVSSPLLAHVKFVYPPNQVDEESTTKNKFRTFYAGSELVVAGRTINSPDELESQVLGFCGVLDDGYTRKKFDKKLKVPVAVEKREDLPLERLWAYLTIKQLLDEKDASDTPEADKNKENSPEKKALALALKYEFVTPLTSLVVVKPNETNAVNAESVDKHKQNSYRGSSYADINTYSLPQDYNLYSSSSGLIDLRISSDLSNQFQPQSIAYQGSAGVNYFGGRPAYSFSSLMLPSAALSNRAGISAAQPAHISGLHYASFPVLADPVGPLSYDYAVDEEDGSQRIQLFRKTQSSYYFQPLSFSHNRADFLSTPLNLMPSTSPAIVTFGLHTYNLEDFPWTESLLNFGTDTIVLQTNDTVTLNLTRDTQVPKPLTGDEKCANAVEGGDGLCVYLTRCSEARNITVDLYKTNYCIVASGFAGVCCHKNKIDLEAVR